MSFTDAMREILAERNEEMSILTGSTTRYATIYGMGASSSTSGGGSSSGSGGSSSSGSGSSSSGSSSSSSSSTSGGSNGTSGTTSSQGTGTTSNTTTTTANRNLYYNYTGGNQVISSYTSGRKIIFNATFAGASFDGAGNFIVNSNLGTLTVQNARDKVIDLSTEAGATFVAAYESSVPTVLDGRGTAGYEIISGSEAGTDAIYAGDGGSQLWGGYGIGADVLVGGNGGDYFMCGKNFGADVILNASSTDAVGLIDSTLSDIVAASSDGMGTVAIAFNTGNVVTIASTELLSAAVVLADGSAYRYNHVTQAWQTA